MAAEEHVDRASEDGQRKRFCMEPIKEPILLPCNERLDLVARGRAWIEELPVEVGNEKVDSIPEPQLIAAYQQVGAACFFFAFSQTCCLQLASGLCKASGQAHCCYSTCALARPDMGLAYCARRGRTMQNGFTRKQDSK